MKHEFRFDEESHSYFIDNVRVPGVTSVLHDLIPGYSAAAWYLGRGRAVHCAAAFVAQGKNFTFDDEIAGQVAAVKSFFSTVKPVVLAVEKPVYSYLWQYAGCLDLIAEIDGVTYICDYKASKTPAVQWQLSAYRLAHGGNIKKGLCIELKADGTFAISAPYDLKRGEGEWLALLTTYKIRKRLGKVNDDGDAQ